MHCSLVPNNDTAATETTDVETNGISDKENHET